MSRIAAIAATVFLIGLAQGALAEASPPASGLIEHVVKTKLKKYEQLTLFLMLPPNGRADGVLCLSLLAKDTDEVRAQLLGTPNRHRSPDYALAFARKHNLAVIAWGAHRLWDPSRNWDDMSQWEAKKIDADFDLVANAWDSGIAHFVNDT